MQYAQRLYVWVKWAPSLAVFAARFLRSLYLRRTGALTSNPCPLTAPGLVSLERHTGSPFRVLMPSLPYLFLLPSVFNDDLVDQ